MASTSHRYGGALPADASRNLKDKILNFNENISDRGETVSLLIKELNIDDSSSLHFKDENRLKNLIHGFEDTGEVVLDK